MSSVLAMPDIPSIVVHNGSSSAPGSPNTERPHSPVRQSRSLSKQDSLSGDTTGGVCETETVSTSVDETATSSQSEVSDSGAVCTPTSGTDENILDNDNSPSRMLSPHIDSDIDPLCIGVEDMAVGQQIDGHSRSDSLELPHQRSQNSDTQSTRSKKNQNSKTKLLQRSHAMREDTSPPPDTVDSSGSSSSPMPGCNNLTVTSSRTKKYHQRVSLNNLSPAITRAFASLSSDVYKEYDNLTDSNGVQTVAFLVNTLCDRPHDRAFLLRVERECSLVLKTSRPYKFSASSSYNRMLIHRVAALYQLSHNVDLVNSSCVIIETSASSKEPPFKFEDILKDLSDDPKRQILKRQCTSCEDFAYTGDMRGGLERRTKSYEEREEAYEKVRKRIFSDEAAERMRLHPNDPSRPMYFAKQDYDYHRHHDAYKSRGSRIHKYSSLETQESLDPHNIRPTVVKAFSFGGIGQKPTLLSRGDSDAGHLPQNSLHKQDSQTSKTSDYTNSSGYKTRQISHDSSANVSAFSTTPSPTTIGPHTPFNQFGGVFGIDCETQPVLWAVTDMDAVPPGALLINPQNGQPVCNKDGTLYKFDRSNPPAVEAASSRVRPYGPLSRSMAPRLITPIEEGHSFYPFIPRPGSSADSTESDDRKPRDSQYQNPPPYAPNYTQETDLNGPMRSMSIAGSASGSDTGSDPQPSSTTNPSARPPSYQQAFYYGALMASGAVPQGNKYMFPPVTSVPPPMPDPVNPSVSQGVPATPTGQDAAIVPQPYVGNYTLVPVHPNGFVGQSTEVYYPPVPVAGQPNIVGANNQNYPIAPGYFNAGMYATAQPNYQGSYYQPPVPNNQIVAPAGPVASNTQTGQPGYLGTRPADQMVAPQYLILPSNNMPSQIIVRPQVPMYSPDQQYIYGNPITHYTPTPMSLRKPQPDASKWDKRSNRITNLHSSKSNGSYQAS